MYVYKYILLFLKSCLSLTTHLSYDIFSPQTKTKTKNNTENQNNIIQFWVQTYIIGKNCYLNFWFIFRLYQYQRTQCGGWSEKVAQELLPLSTS